MAPKKAPESSAATPRQDDRLPVAPDDPKNPRPPAGPYEKPRVRIYAPLDELTFVTGFGASGIGVVVSGGGV